jgi:hypothetical protein
MNSAIEVICDDCIFKLDSNTFIGNTSPNNVSIANHSSIPINRENNLIDSQVNDLAYKADILYAYVRLYKLKSGEHVDIKIELKDEKN